MGSFRLYFFALLFVVPFERVLAEPKSTDFSRDSLTFYEKTKDYLGAKRYLEFFINSSEISNDSLKIQWLFELSEIESLLKQNDEVFLTLQKIKDYAFANKSELLKFKVNVRLIELLRSIRSYEKAVKVIKENELRVGNQPPIVISAFYHRSAAVYNEFHYKKEDIAYLDTAIAFAEKSLEIAKEHEFRDHIAMVYNELGNIYEKLEQFDKSLEYYNNSILLWKGIEDLNYANALKNKGSYYLRIKENDSAIVYFNKTLKEIEDQEYDFRFFGETYWGLSEAYLANNDSINGLKNRLLEAHYYMKHSDQVIEDKIIDLTVAYEAKEKDAIILDGKKTLELEQLKNRIIIGFSAVLLLIVITLVLTFRNIKKKNTTLSALLKENEFLISESNHRIKNNLQLIISLIGREIYKSEKAKTELLEISEKINSIATLHQQLYLKESKDNISVKEYIKNIVENFKSGLYSTDVNFRLNIVDFDLEIEKAVYLGLLVTELITNSLKHAFLEHADKKIDIGIKELMGEITLEYRDNGIGLEEGKATTLVNLLVQQLKAKYSIKSSIGYSLTIHFKR